MEDFEFAHSDDIAELSAAMSKAQGAMTGAITNSENPFFKSKYADLSAVWEDIREPFADNNLSVIQMPCNGVGVVVVITQITHSSGQWIRCKLSMVPMKADPQGIGSCITYARRYALAAMAGVYQTDDDAASASKQNQISIEPIDMDKVQTCAKRAIELIDNDSEDYTLGIAIEILESLSNDERIALQGILKSTKPEGTKKTYFSCFRDHLKLEREPK